MNIKLFYEDDNIIVALKEPKIPSQPDKTGDKDMLTIISEYTNIKDIGLINRLDRPVGGIMVFSKNKKYNTILSKLMSENKINKTYLAVVYGNTPQSGCLKNFMLKNTRLNMSSIVDSNIKGAKEAILYYEKLDFKKDENIGEVSLLKIRLETGRHHQIRVQFSNAGFPIVGDPKYSNIKTKNINIALFSSGLSFEIDKKKFNFFDIPVNYPFNIFKYNINNITM